MAGAVQDSPIRYTGPPFDKAHVRDAMRIGVVTCRPDTPVRDVARMMDSYGIHSIVVESDGESGHPLGIISALDIATAQSPDVLELTAADLATTYLITVKADQNLREAARLMSGNGVTHLVVLQPETERSVGVISASGLMAAVSTPVD